VGEGVDCFTNWDGNCYLTELKCDNYKNDECINRTMMRCFPTEEGCRYVFSDICIVLFSILALFVEGWEIVPFTEHRQRLWPFVSPHRDV
jgi:hypothetical protein